MNRLSRSERLQRRKRKFIVQVFFIICIILLLIFVPTFPSAFIFENTSPLHLSSTIWLEKEKEEKKELHAKYKQQIQSWINQISMDKAFEEWSFASWESYILEEREKNTLWAIIGSIEESEVGYIIVEEQKKEDVTPNNIYLREYGKNDVGLLSKFLEEHHSFQLLNYAGLVWSKIEEDGLYHLIYRATYEQVEETHLPLNWTGGHPSQLVQQQKLLYDELIQPLAILAYKKEFSSFTEAEPYYYYTQFAPEKYGVYPLIAVHSWSTEAEAHDNYVGMENYGIRFFPEEYLKQSGQIISFDLSIFGENTF